VALTGGGTPYRAAYGRSQLDFFISPGSRLCLDGRRLPEEVRLNPAPVKDHVQHGNDGKDNAAPLVHKFECFPGQHIVQESHQDLIDQENPEHGVDYLQYEVLHELLLRILL
jgi:hypothetical protein